MCLLAMHTSICVTFSLPPYVSGWLRLLLVALPRLFYSPLCTCKKAVLDIKPARIPRVPMGSLQVGLSCDCVDTGYHGPLPVTGRWHRCIILFTDNFIKNVIIPVSDMTAEVCAVRLLNEVIFRWVVPCHYIPTKVERIKVEY